MNLEFFRRRLMLMLLTTAVCIAGMFAFSEMKVELLPKEESNTFILVIENDGRSSDVTERVFRKTLADAAGQLGAKLSLTFEPKKAVGIFKPDHNDKEFDQNLKSAIKKIISANNWSGRWFVTHVAAHNLSSLTLVVTAKATQVEMNDLVKNEIVPAVGRIVGVARIETKGLAEDAIRLVSDPVASLAAGQGLWSTFSLVANALNLPMVMSNHVSSVQIQTREFSPSYEHWANVPISVPESSLTTPLGAFVEVAAPNSEPETSIYFNNEAAVTLNIFRQPMTSDLEVSDKVREWVRDFAKKHSSVQIDVVNDLSDYIRASERNVTNNLRDGIILTCLCVWLFIRSKRKTFLVAISIPISVLAAFPFLLLFGLTRNLMTMAGVILAVGIVVDAALSVIQEMEDYVAQGLTLELAAKKAARSNFVPIFVTSLTTLAVFVPILFLDGTVGTLFYDLSLTFIVAQLTSFFVAVFIAPVLGWYVYELFPLNIGKKTAKQDFFQKFLDSTEVGVRRILSSFKASLFLSVVFLVMVLLSFLHLPPQEFLPRSGQGDYRAIVHLGHDASASLAQSTAKKLSQLMSRHEFSNIFVEANEDEVIAEFKSNKALRDLEVLLSKNFAPYATLLTEKNPLDKNASNGKDVEFFIPYYESPETRNAFKRKVSEIEGVKLTRWTKDEKHYVVQLKPTDQSSPNLLVPASSFDDVWGALRTKTTVGFAPKGAGSNLMNPVPVTFYEQENSLSVHPVFPYAIENNLLAMTEKVEREVGARFFVDGNPYEKVSIAVIGKTSKEVAADVLKIASADNIKIRWDDTVLENEESIQSLQNCIVIALVLVLLILFAQNRSVSTTVIVMFTFIWGPIGSIPGLWAHAETLNGSALVGFILLAGTIVNNGVLLMDIVSKYRVQQLPPVECCIKAMKERSLNVVVTALTTVFGMLPMVFDNGSGAQMYRGLSIVVVYGTLVSTPISLIGIPCLVTIFGHGRELIERLKLRAEVVFYVQRSRGKETALP